MKLTLLLILTLACLLSACDEECFEKEPNLYIYFKDTLDNDIKVDFDRVYGVGAETDWQFNSTRYVPLDLSSDSTVFFFTKNAKTDTIRIYYTRILESVDVFCYQLKINKISSSFKLDCFHRGYDNQPASGIYECNNDNYEVYLYY